MRLPFKLKAFVNGSDWVFAKTYEHTWPHEYIVRDHEDKILFLLLVRHIREHGYEGRFYRKPITYFNEHGYIYWTMGAPVEETTIVNRCTGANLRVPPKARYSSSLKRQESRTALLNPHWRYLSAVSH